MSSPLATIRARAAAALGLTLLCAVAAVVALRLTSLLRPRSAPSPVDARQIQRMRADAVQLFNNGQLEQAQAAAGELLRKVPGDPDAHLLMGEVLVGREKYQQAYERIARAVELRPDQDQTHFFAGVIASRLGRWDQALAHHLRAAQLQPQTAKYPLYAATDLLNLSRLDEASEQARRASELDPSIPEPHMILAQVADRRSDPDAAIGCLDKAMGLIPPADPKRIDYALYKSQILRRTDRADQSVNLLTALEPQQQGDERVVAELAQCYLALSQPAKAAVVWAELFAQRRGAGAAAQAGLCMAKAGDLKQARRYLGYARAIDSRNPAVAQLERSLAGP